MLDKPYLNKHPRNGRWQRHGFWKYYTLEGKIWFQGFYFHNKRFGYHFRNDRDTTNVKYKHYYAR